MGRRLHRYLKTEQLESRRPLAADMAALDVNDDMSVTSLDALIIINELNQGASATTTFSTATTAEAEDQAQLDCDVNSDGIVSPLDVLNVVNQINTGTTAVAIVIIDPDTDPTPTDTTPTDTTDTPIDNTPTDGTTTEDPGTGDSTDSPTDDSTDTTDPTDNTGDDTTPNDGTDSNSPGDTTDDTTGDDTTDDDTTDDDTTDDGSDTSDPTDDDTTDDDTTDPPTDDGHCNHGNGAGGLGGHHGVPVVQGQRAGHHGRGDIFDDLDDNGDGALSSDEVPAGLWNRLSAADADGSGSVTEAELEAYKEAQRVAAVEAFFDQLDKDGSGAITSSDVSRLTWRFLSRADGNSDGSITVEELLAAPMPGRMGH